MINAVIIDDEVKSRETICEMLRIYCANVEVVAQAGDVKSGILAIRKHNPDLILLDIRMPDGTGFDLLRQLPGLESKVVFITAYEEYAIKAFKFSALDYVLKPIDPDELKAAIDKADVSIKKENISDRISTFFQHYNSDTPPQKKQIALRNAESIYRVAIDDIVSYEADKNYTLFHLCNGEKILVSHSIKEYDDILLSMNFIRLHQSYSINLKHLKRYDKEENEAVMSDNSKIPVSHRRKEELMRLLMSI
ncbi:MAG: LytR/AlgR family response regulator transcription factor [Bacteroidales bacterium]